MPNVASTPASCPSCLLFESIRGFEVRVGIARKAACSTALRLRPESLRTLLRWVSVVPTISLHVSL